MSEGTEGAVQVKLEVELTMVPAMFVGSCRIQARITANVDPRIHSLPWFDVQEALRKKYLAEPTGADIRFVKPAKGGALVTSGYEEWTVRAVGDLFRSMRMLSRDGDWHLNLKTGRYWVEGVL